MRSLKLTVLTVDVLLLILQNPGNVYSKDIYVTKTGKTRATLLATGDYLPASVFGSTKRNSKEVFTLEDYLPVHARGKGEGSTNRGYSFWPRTFETNLKMVPWTAEHVKFILHTVRSKPEGEVISDRNLTTIRKSTWNANNDVKILVHGYRQRASSAKMPQAQKDAYLFLNNTYNIVIVNWEYLANDRNYFESAMNSIKVGRRLGEFIVALKNREFSPSYANFHIIGYCLGAHAAGVAGDYVHYHSAGGSLIWRITGLDPAGPGFLRARPELRLDNTDAQFVDCIHTNYGDDLRNGKLGTTTPCGDVDFYPNGGVSQPVCGDIRAVGNLISKCSHRKAADYYARSIKGEKFLSCKCRKCCRSFIFRVCYAMNFISNTESWGQFLNHVCPCEIGPFMGEYVQKISTGPHYLRVFEYSLFDIFEQMGVFGDVD